MPIFPSLLTSLNLFSGLIAIFLSTFGEVRLASIMILVAAVWDGLDGFFGGRTTFTNVELKKQ